MLCINLLMISATEFQPPAHPAFSLSTLWSRQLRDVDRTVWYSRSVLHGSEEKRSKSLCSTRAVGSSKAEFDENPKARVQCSQPAIARFAQASRRAVQLLHEMPPNRARWKESRFDGDALERTRGGESTSVSGVEAALVWGRARRAFFSWVHVGRCNR